MNISGEIHVHKTETPISSLPEIDEVTGEELVRVYVNGIPKRVVVDTLLENAGGGSGGQPTPVNSSEKFTNTDELYLYLGNEEGYDYGYIYAYVDGDWTKTALYGKGEDGEPGRDGADGTPGQDGADGYSPDVTVASTATGAEITVTDKSGTRTAEVSNGTATDAQVAAWLEAHPEATTTVQDNSITDAKLVQSGGILSRFAALKNKQKVATLTAADFVNGYYTRDSISSSANRICANKLYDIEAGDIIVIDERTIQIGLWVHEGGVIVDSPTNVFGYADAKPQYWVATMSGKAVFQGKKVSGSITPSAFTGSITIVSPLIKAVDENTQNIAEAKNYLYTQRTLTAADFVSGARAQDESISQSVNRISSPVLVFEPGESVTFGSDTLELGAWVKYEGDERYTNLLPYTANVKPIRVDFTTPARMFFIVKNAAGTSISPSDYNCDIVVEKGKIDGRVAAAISASEAKQDEKLVSKRAELYLGTMVQAANDVDGIQAATTRLCMKNVLALPHGDRTELTVHINPAYKIAVRVGPSPYNLNSNLYWYTDGDTIPLPSGASFYRVGVANLAATTIELSEWDDIDLHIYYPNDATDFSPFDSAANAAMLYNPSGSSNMNYRTLPTFVHTSDVHGDYVRVKRFAEYAKRLGASMACLTGDITGYNIHADSNHFEWFHDILKNSGIQWGVCVGNHDSHVGSGSSAYTMADEDLYDIFYDPIASEIGNETGKLWYVKDMAAQKIRVISLDLYQAGGVWTYTYFTQEQLTWLCSVLASTPANYGVIILMHAQQLSVVKDNDYPKFFQTVRKGETAEHYNAVDNDGDPIGDIVNAFINKTTISKSYTQNSGAETLTVSGDFTGVASGVEFICYMTGHFHQDTVGYQPRPSGDPKQLVLNVTCGCSVYGGGSYKYLADCSDLPRNPKDATQDAFNVYGIDRTAKTVRIARVGSTMNSAFELRDHMIIPYA